ncbi:bacteriohemerythrin [Candidatus Magnetomonas plexicatena]|uniref:bacteriohemerythrin n=1 Tax=Candidatus Magnetomonas plexicatena TaxID=2552947 RepID=UPI0010FFEB1C|nr:hemerythrin family protein [Nitrospirales bacterium LBB_01]
MSLITWNDNLSVGVKELDDQHKKLIALINELFDAVTARKGKDALGPVLSELVEYTKYHFGNEERLFATHGYVNAAAHKQEHDDLTQKVISFDAQFKAGRAMVDLLLMNFLKDWLTKHIVGTDKKYSAFLNEKGIK